MLPHKTESPYNFYMLFPIYTKLLKHSATHWTQEVRQTLSNLDDIYRSFSPHHTLQHDMQVTAVCPLTWPRPEMRGARAVHCCLQL